MSIDDYVWEPSDEKELYKKFRKEYIEKNSIISSYPTIIGYSVLPLGKYGIQSNPLNQKNYSGKSNYNASYDQYKSSNGPCKTTGNGDYSKSSNPSNSYSGSPSSNSK